MKEELSKQIGVFLREIGVENPKVVFEYPARMEFGDLSTNVAMMYAKQLGQKPVDLAGEIKEMLVTKEIQHILRIDVVAPGFINFFFDQHFFAKSLEYALGSGYGKNTSLGGQKFFIEHTQPNPFKEFHIGHMMNNTIGESVSRIIKGNNAEVKIASYHGDVGLHVAKAIWGIQKSGKMVSNVSDLGQAYAAGASAYENDETAQKEIVEINKRVYDKQDPEIRALYDLGKKISLDYFEGMYKKLDSHFDFHFYESDSGAIGKKLVEENIGKIFEKGEEGAVIFRGENFEPKTHTRVFLNKEGLPTYEAKEVGLAEIKKSTWAYDISLTVTANEQDSFFDVVEVAIGEVFLELKGKLTHISHGMLKLPSGKMSSRTGSIISADDLMSQVSTKALEKVQDREFSQEEKEKLAEIIAVGAIKYTILHQAIGGDIIFDFEKSISFEGDSGPYLQYATVRANSLLKKAEGIVDLDSKIPEGWETVDLERMLERFPAVVEKAGREYAPHHIVTYLVELAGEFNSFYANHKIIDKEDPTSPYRLALTKAFTQVMTSGLDLLGIKVPEKM
jgi:arginyl-tRNA synthetase